MMRKLIAATVMAAVLLGGVPAFADEEQSAFQKYVVSPAQWGHQAIWGVVTLAFKIGKAPVDKGFTLAGKILGSDPNKPLWE